MSDSWHFFLSDSEIISVTQDLDMCIYKIWLKTLFWFRYLWLSGLSLFISWGENSQLRARSWLKFSKIQFLINNQTENYLSPVFNILQITSCLYFRWEKSKPGPHSERPPLDPEISELLLRWLMLEKTSRKPGGKVNFQLRMMEFSSDCL